MDWTAEDWRCVAFSDKSIFRVFGTDGIEWCWRKPGERLDQRYTKKKVKHGGSKVTVWGMITYPAVGRIVHIEGNMDRFLYREILDDDLWGSFQDLGLNLANYYYQQDGDPKHWASICREWFEDHSIDLLPWVPSSADMNIIENVWSQLERQIRARPILPQTETQ